MASAASTAFEVETQIIQFDSLLLDCGVTLRGVDVAYETYGTLNAERTNAILVLHAFSGDAHAAGLSKETGQPGWWSQMIGPGLAFDTDCYFVISSNVLGGCRGTTGPASIDPVTHKPYGMQFPVITIGDMARLQKLLVEHLGIERLLAVAGGSMGGMQALEWAVAYPDSVAAAIPIATTSTSQCATDRVQRGGQAGRDGRPGLERGRLLRFATAWKRFGGGAHGGSHHVHERCFHAAEIRPPAER